MNVQHVQKALDQMEPSDSRCHQPNHWNNWGCDDRREISPGIAITQCCSYFVHLMFEPEKIRL